jgi:hypothetical protein
MAKRIRFQKRYPTAGSLQLLPNIFDVVNRYDLPKSHLQWLFIFVNNNDLFFMLSRRSGITNA